MNIYLMDSYKLILKSSLEERKRLKDKQLTFNSMAEYCHIQKTYLSKVLNRDGNLNLDQLYLACQYLSLSQDETAYCFLLHSYETSQVEVRRSEIFKKIDRVREAKLRTEAYVQVSSIELKSDVLNRYYLDPLYSVIHMLLTIRRFAKDPKSIAPLLQLKPQKAAQYIRGLEDMGIIELKEAGIRVLRNNIHLPKGSPLLPPYRMLMRLKALSRLDASDNTQDYTFSVIFSSSPAVRRKIQERFLGFLEETQTMVSQCNSEEVFQMNFDLLKWS